MFYLDIYPRNSKEERVKVKSFIDEKKIGPLGKKPTLKVLSKARLLE
jgi:hypothetical protein